MRATRLFSKRNIVIVFIACVCWFFFSTSAIATVYNVCDYGAIADDGQDDTFAFQAAVNKGGIVQVPTGTYQLTVSGRTGLVCPKSVQILGDGWNSTRIITEEKLLASGIGIIFQPGTQVVLRGLTLAGPSDLNGFFCPMVIHYGGLRGLLRIENCKISGGHMAGRMEELNGKQENPEMTVSDSVIASPTGLHHLNSGLLRVTRTQFSDYGIPGSNQEHAIYTYLPVSLWVDSCVFDGNKGLGFDIHPYSSHLIGKGDVTIRNSDFRGNWTRSILTHAETLTDVRNCSLGKTIIQVRRGGAIFTECSFYSAAYIQPWPYYPPGPGTWTFKNCTFEQQTVLSGIS